MLDNETKRNSKDDPSDVAAQLLLSCDGDLAMAENHLRQAAAEAAATQNRQKNKTASGPIIARSENISKVFNQGKSNQVNALTDVNLQVHEGEIVALVGSSGSGKTTLLNTMAGLENPTGGKVIIGGKDISTLGDRQLSKFRSETIGFVFQFFYLQPFLSLEKNIQVPLMFSGVKSKSERQRRSDELIDLVGLSDRKSHLPKELSGGQMQRVAIARALINRPKLIIADEPTGNLDNANAQSVMDLLEDVKRERGGSVLVVTHDQKIANRADRVLHLSDGRVV